MSTLVILGTARNDSNTLTAIHTLRKGQPDELIELHRLNIQPYQYDHPAQAADDFLSVAQKMAQAQTIIFATPVYWYSMSGQLKNFFDRLTELLSTHKVIGKSFAGKEMRVIASGAESHLPEGFEVPFQRTAEYFGMTYGGIEYRSAHYSPSAG